MTTIDVCKHTYLQVVDASSGVYILLNQRCSQITTADSYYYMHIYSVVSLVVNNLSFIYVKANHVSASVVYLASQINNG